MKLSTGKIAFPIEFDNGDKDCIYFNPNDPDLGTRLIAARDKIQKRIDEIDLEGLDLANNGELLTSENPKNIYDIPEEKLNEIIYNAEKISKVVNETKTVACEELNTAFGSDISSVVFKHCSPFAIVDGDYFIINFLDAIAPEIKKHTNKANADLEKKMSKHLSKYIK